MGTFRVVLHQRSLDNYRQLVARVDELCAGISQRLAGQLACHEGCDACCLHISLFPVEAAVLAEAIGELPVARRQALRNRALQAATDGPCPLLDDHACLVYAARPIICRTHGLPILSRLDGETLVDFCRENCREITSLTGDCVIDLDRLNETLTAINALFLQESGADNQPRLSVADVVLHLDG